AVVAFFRARAWARFTGAAAIQGQPLDLRHMEVDHQRVRCAVRAWSSTLALVSCLACSRDKVGQERAPTTEQASDASLLQSGVELPESASGRSPKRQGPTPKIGRASWRERV